MRHIKATHEYSNTFEMDVPDDMTDEEIWALIQSEDEYLCGDWCTDFEVLYDFEEDED